MKWIYDDPPDTPYEKRIYKILVRLLRNKDVAHKGARNLGLFKFLSENRFDSSSELRRNVLLSEGKPFFRPADAKTVWTFFKQTGGRNPVLDLPPVTEPEGESHPGFTATTEETHTDTSGSAYDKIVDRWLKFWFALTPQFMKDPINMISPFMYPLQTLEFIPVYGDSLALAVDVVAQMNKNAAKMAQQYTPMIMGFAPIPEASTVGIVVGYMISTMFIFFNMIIFTTRHHFGEAFKQSLALIPFAGMALENAADSGDGLVGKYGKTRLKIIDQLNESGIFAWLGWLITWMTVDPFYEGDPEKDAEWLKGEAGKHFEQAKSYGSELYTNLNNPEKRSETMETLKQKASELKQRAQQGIKDLHESEFVKTAKNKTTQGLASLGKAVAPSPVSTSQRIMRGEEEGTFEKLRRKASEKLTGKGLSKMRSHKGKWRTQKRSKM